jgi:hypothetical protein
MSAAHSIQCLTLLIVSMATHLAFAQDSDADKLLPRRFLSADLAAAI